MVDLNNQPLCTCSIITFHLNPKFTERKIFEDCYNVESPQARRVHKLNTKADKERIWTTFLYTLWHTTNNKNLELEPKAEGTWSLGRYGIHRLIKNVVHAQIRQVKYCEQFSNIENNRNKSNFKIIKNT